MAKPQLILFSDLDGTLLDHDSYSWASAQPALERLRMAGIPLVLSSSKTSAEMAVIREDMGNHDPYIVENGAAVVIPEDYFGDPKAQVVTFGASRDVVLSELGRLRAAGAQFQGFQDMAAEELAELTGLDVVAASRALQRHATEPLIWQGSDAELEEFRGALAAANLRLVQGGRFWHAMGIFDKADGARFLLEKYQERYGRESLLAIALGDSPNDQQLLESADIPVVIRGFNSDSVQLPSDRHAVRSLRSGPEGWNDCVLNLLFEYGY